eukprot:gene4982-8576_t
MDEEELLSLDTSTNEDYLISMGFKKNDVKKALSINKNTEVALDWLLQNVETKVVEIELKNTSEKEKQLKKNKENEVLVLFQSDEEENEENKTETFEEQIKNYRFNKSNSKSQKDLSSHKKRAEEREIQSKKIKEMNFTDAEYNFIVSKDNQRTIDLKVNMLLKMKKEIFKFGLNQKDIDFMCEMKKNSTNTEFSIDDIIELKSAEKLNQLNPTDYWKMNPDYKPPNEVYYPHKLDELPRDTIAHILSYTDKSTVMNASIISTGFDVAKSNLIWRNFLRDFVAYEESKAHLLPESQKHHKLILLEDSIDQYTVKQQYANHVKGNVLRQRRIELEEIEEKNIVKWQVSCTRFFMWTVYLSILISCITVSGIYIPFNVDFFNTSYYWLIGYAPLLLISLIHFPLITFDGYKSGFYPFPKLECGGVTQTTPSLDVVIYFMSLFNSIPILIVITGLISFIPGAKELKLWTIFLTPVILCALWDVFTFFIVGIRVLLTIREDEEYDPTLKGILYGGFVGTVICLFFTFIFYSLSILFISLKLDGHIPTMYWSIIFIFMEIGGFFLVGLLCCFAISMALHYVYLGRRYKDLNFGSSVLRIISCDDDSEGFFSDYDDDEFNLWVFLAFILTLVVTILVTVYCSFFISILLLGLVMDGIFNTWIILVTAVPFIVGMVVIFLTLVCCSLSIACCICFVWCCASMLCCFDCCDDLDCDDWFCNPFAYLFGLCSLCFGDDD